MRLFHSELNDATLKLSYRVRDDMQTEKRSFLEEDNKKYFDMQYGYLDFSNCGIEKIYMDIF